jgi:hypothetical protein
MSDELDLMLDNNYDLPEDRNEFINDSTGEVIKKEDLNPFEVIKRIAQRTGTVIREPKENCKKCYGKGYTAIRADTKAPVECKCIFPPRTKEQKEEDLQLAQRFLKHPRSVRRKMQRDMKKKIQKQKLKEKRKKDNE